MAALGKKKSKKGKTLTLTDFLAEDNKGSVPNYAPVKSSSWADDTNDLDGEFSTSWNSDDVYRAPPIDRSILPTAPRAAREPNVDRSRLPRSPPYTAFLGNLPYDVTEDCIKDFFHGLNISAVRLPREPSNPERLKGFGYAEFDDVESLLQALTLNEENLGSRRIRVDVADQSNDKERDSGFMSGRDRDRDRFDGGPDRTDSDWRARPSTDSDDGPRRDGNFSERSRDRYETDKFRDGPRRDRYDDRYDGGRDRYRDKYDERERRDYDRGGFDSYSGGRRTFGSSFRRDYDDRRDDSRQWDRYGDREDRYERREEREPPQRPRLNLKPRSVPKTEELGSASDSQSSRASIFGGAKPVDTAAKEREVEERLKKEQEKLQKRVEEDKGRPRERDSSWRSDDLSADRTRTGGESAQPGHSSDRSLRQRENEPSLENEVSGGCDQESCSTGKQDGVPLKMMPTPPPKENGCTRRSESCSPDSLCNGPPQLTSPQFWVTLADKNMVNGLQRNQGQTGPSGSGRLRGDAASRDRRKEADSNPHFVVSGARYEQLVLYACFLVHSRCM
uniref:Eukaryotic translation initiation factor 4B n=1 Tax=Scleropages formosus TaxID=113540 RepID=A0A8C9SVX9_SCLFO